MCTLWQLLAIGLALEGLGDCLPAGVPVRLSTLSKGVLVYAHCAHKMHRFEAVKRLLAAIVRTARMKRSLLHGASVVAEDGDAGLDEGVGIGRRGRARFGTGKTAVLVGAVEPHRLHLNEKRCFKACSFARASQ